MKTAIIICTRSDSSRVPRKPFKKICGKPILEHLLDRLAPSKIPIILAYPFEQIEDYQELKIRENVYLHDSIHYDDVLKRMNDCAKEYKVENIIRISHDKILVNPEDLFSALGVYFRKNLDYLYSSSLIAGTGFEIINAKVLDIAANRFDDVEHVSYAIKAVTSNDHNYVSNHKDSNFRFLIDYPKDVDFLEVLFSQVGSDANLNECIDYLNKNPEIKKINQLPRVTVYTCAHNAEKFIQKAMDSVAGQSDFKKWEYILVDDGSTDKTCELMAKFCLKHKNARWIRNEKNIGLSSSSNKALKEATGHYIIRLDADDTFSFPGAIRELLSEIESTGKDVIYPNCFFGSYYNVQSGKESHHVGGSIFKKSALNYIKFTDGLRGYEGLDLFMRAKSLLNIGYLNKPMFFYTQRDDSLSKSNLDDRKKIKEEIVRKYENTAR